MPKVLYYQFSRSEEPATGPVKKQINTADTLAYYFINIPAISVLSVSKTEFCVKHSPVGYTAL